MSKMKLDDLDHKILDMLIENTRIPFTDIAKKLLISAGTVHVRVKKMEDAGDQERKTIGKGAEEQRTSARQAQDFRESDEQRDFKQARDAYTF